MIALTLAACTAAGGAEAGTDSYSDGTNVTTEALGAPQADSLEEDVPRAAASEDDPDCPICDVDLSDYDGPLTEAEIEGLLLALNDEYHAWAVYDRVQADLGQVRPFSNIQRAEAAHIQALQRLFDTYGVLFPDNPWPGNVPAFDSRAAACRVGVEAEILNVELYDQLFNSTDRQDILRVYTKLRSASLDKHLPAFERCAG